MKPISIITVFLIFLNLSCAQKSEIENGIYMAENDELYYAIELDNSTNQIKVFVLESYVENSPSVSVEQKKIADPNTSEVFDIKTEQKRNREPDFKHFFSGNFSVENNRLIIKNLESDIMPGQRPENISAEISAGEIILNCEELSKYLSGNSDYCKSNQIVFVKN